MTVADHNIIFLRLLKGAPLAVLVAIRVLGRSGTLDLATATGYGDEAITSALRLLGKLGYIERASRYVGWRLTTLAAQLPLFAPYELAGSDLTEREPGKTGLEPGKTGLPQLSGGGGFKSPYALKSVLTTTTTTDYAQREPGKTGLEPGKTGLPQLGASVSGAPVDKTDPETGRLAELLVVRALCNRPRSLTAVATARATGADPATIEIEILRWLAWLAHPKTNTSNLVNPGYFIAKKIADREPAPTGFVAAWSADEKRIQHLMCQREAAADTEDGEEEEEEEEEEDEEAAAADA